MTPPLNLNTLCTIYGSCTTSGNIQFHPDGKYVKIESSPANDLLNASNSEPDSFYDTFKRYMALKAPIVSEEA